MDILSPGSINNSTRLILANALYFKGARNRVFHGYGGNGASFNFYLLNGNPIKVPFMTRSKKEYISAFDGFTVLKLSYKQAVWYSPSFLMYIFLPDAKDGLWLIVHTSIGRENCVKIWPQEVYWKFHDFKI